MCAINILGLISYIKQINSNLHLRKCSAISIVVKLLVWFAILRGNLNIRNRLIPCEVAMLLLFPLGRRVNFAPKEVPVGFKTQKTQRSIQELLLNTKISGINGQKILFFSFGSHARTLSILLLIKQLALQHGVAMRYPST